MFDNLRQEFHLSFFVIKNFCYKKANVA